jgi:hypothetical protein
MVACNAGKSLDSELTQTHFQTMDSRSLSRPFPLEQLPRINSSWNSPSNPQPLTQLHTESQGLPPTDPNSDIRILTPNQALSANDRAQTILYMPPAVLSRRPSSKSDMYKVHPNSQVQDTSDIYTERDLLSPYDSSNTSRNRAESPALTDAHTARNDTGLNLTEGFTIDTQTKDSLIALVYSFNLACSRSSSCNDFSKVGLLGVY